MAAKHFPDVSDALTSYANIGVCGWSRRTLDSQSPAADIHTLGLYSPLDTVSCAVWQFAKTISADSYGELVGPADLSTGGK
jgi:hypothetical protein